MSGTPSIVELLDRLARLEARAVELERDDAELRRENAVLRAETAGPAGAGLVELVAASVVGRRGQACAEVAA
ncbi:hypothetical protein ACN27F_16315 [Solwaraspora sp. WMMB335]|uniref:hypothetical protein n=1 Tax=Solwaraspora sp. WMMB335 TaxID=3404118 RepID=UPI003B9498D9